MKKYLQRSLIGSLGAVSSTTVYTSLWQTIDSFNSYMIQITYTGTPTATVILEVSADPIPALETFGAASNQAPTNFDTVASSSKSAASVNILTYDVTSSAGNWARLKWTNASGTGIITAVNFVGKGALV